MSLAANLQLATGSVTPPKLDLNANFSAAGLTATTAMVATDYGVGTAVVPEGLLTLYSGNDIDATFHSVKTDGDVSLFLNNDSDINWGMSLRGTNTDTLQFVNDSQQAEFASEYTALSIKTTGAVGVGTNAPDAATILDIVSNNSASASLRLYNSTTNVDMRMLSGTGEGTIGTASNTTLKIFANNTNAIYVGTDGHVGVGGASDGTYMLNVAGDINLTGNIYENGSQTASWTDDSGDIYRLSNVGIGLTDPQYDLHVRDSGAASISQIGVDTYNASNLAYGSEILFRRSNSDTDGAVTATVDTQTIGILTFHGVNSTNAFSNAADISVVQNGAAGASYVAADIIFKTGTSAAAPVERLRIDFNGNVIPGTDSALELGSSTYRWSTLYVDTVGDTGQDLTIAATTTNLPLGHIFDYDNANVTITHSSNTLTISGGTTVVDALTSGGNIVSDTDSTDDIGTTSTRWANVYTDSIGDTGQDLTIAATTINLPSGHIFDYNSGDVTITHSANALTIAGGNTVVDSLTSGGNIVSDTDSTDDLGTSSVRWQTLYVDTLGDNGQALGIAATTLSFDTAATIDTSGNNQLDINTGSSNTVITAAAVTVSNDFTVDTTTLHVDSTNDNVGIGTATPNSLYSLDVVGDINFSGNLYQGGVLFSGGGGGGLWTQSGSDIYYNTGNVGIGNTGPNYALDVTGSINFTGTLYQNGVQFVSGGGGGGGNPIDFPDVTSVSNDAHKIVFIDLDSPRFVWDWEVARRRIRGTSWYTELTAPPVYGAIIIDASKNALHWVDRTTSSLTPYMTFNVGANNILDGTTINDVVFKDFVLYVSIDSGGGVARIDLLSDHAEIYKTTGVNRYSNNITNRNNGDGYSLYNANPASISDTVYSVAVERDPDGDVDYLDRPNHYWAAGTDDEITLFIPNINGNYTAYDSDLDASAAVIDYLHMENDQISFGVDQTDEWVGVRNFKTISADSWTYDYKWSPGTANGDGRDLPISTGTINMSGVQVLPGSAISGENLLLFSSAIGLNLIHQSGSNGVDSGHIVITSSHTTPYMKGTRIAAYPLLDTNDKSGNGYDFTSQASPPTFSTAGIYGNSASFDGTQYLVQTVTDFGPVSDFTISLMMKTNDNTLPVADEFLARLTDGTNHSLSLWATTSGGINFNVYNNPTTDSWISNSVYDSQWHHIVFTRSGSTYYAYIDGILVNTWASTVSSATNLTQITIGGDQLGNQRFGGQIEQVFFGKSVLTTDEVLFDYTRMKNALGGTTATITSNTVDSVRVDPDTGYAIVAAGNDVHIIEAQTGLVYATDSDPTDTINDADIRSMVGSETPHYLLGGATSIEQVAPEILLTGGGVDAAGGGDANVSTIFFLMGA